MSNLNQFIASNMMNLFRISDYSSSYDRFYFDLLAEVAPLDDFKFLELYSSPFFFDKGLNTGPESGWDTVMD